MVPLVKLGSNLDHEEVARLRSRGELDDPEKQAAVAGIIEQVKTGGDRALIELTRRFDGASLTPARLRVGPDETEAAVKRVPLDFMEALEMAARRIRTYHERQKRDIGQDFWRIREPDGTWTGQMTMPLGRVGAYVPGGAAAYPSSLLMNVIPAQVAGVAEIAVCVPPSAKGDVSPYTLAAAAHAGCDEVYRVGGAQAIAALAYGTETIRRVDKITGPGNIYVTLAKKQVLGAVDIDMLAGPSEIVIVADLAADPLAVAADMLAQAEHDRLATAICICLSEEFAGRVTAELDGQITLLTRGETARQSLDDHGRFLVVDNLDVAIELADKIAPEHLELMVENAANYVERVPHAGAVFVGALTPEAVGDYVAGPNHILPTAGSARFGSPLGVLDFYKRTSVVSCTPMGVHSIGPAAETIARAEGLDAHANSLRVRLGRRE